MMKSRRGFAWFSRSIMLFAVVAAPVVGRVDSVTAGTTENVRNRIDLRAAFRAQKDEHALEVLQRVCTLRNARLGGRDIDAAPAFDGAKLFRLSQDRNLEQFETFKGYCYVSIVAHSAFGQPYMNDLGTAVDISTDGAIFRYDFPWFGRLEQLYARFSGELRFPKRRYLLPVAIADGYTILRIRHQEKVKVPHFRLIAVLGFNGFAIDRNRHYVWRDVEWSVDEAALERLVASAGRFTSADELERAKRKLSGEAVALPLDRARSSVEAAKTDGQLEPSEAAPSATAGSDQNAPEEAIANPDLEADAKRRMSNREAIDRAMASLPAPYRPGILAIVEAFERAEASRSGSDRRWSAGVFSRLLDWLPKGGVVVNVNWAGQPRGPVSGAKAERSLRQNIDEPFETFAQLAAVWTDRGSASFVELKFHSEGKKLVVDFGPYYLTFAIESGRGVLAEVAGGGDE